MIWHCDQQQTSSVKDVLLNGESIGHLCFMADEESRTAFCFVNNPPNSTWQGDRLFTEDGLHVVDIRHGKVEIVREAA